MTREELIVSRFSRASSVPWTTFKHVVDEAVRKYASIQRLDCLNPNKAIKHDFDFSIIPSIDIRQAWRQFLKLRIDNPLFTLGIRDSLMVLFELLKKRDMWPIALPTDVYPVYQQIADASHLHYVHYKTLFPTFKIEDALVSDIVLLTFPLYGRDINAREVDCLLNWLKESPNRLVIIDRVYDYLRENPYIQKLIDTNQVIVCYSLTKTFLSPLLLGLTILPQTYSPIPHTASTQNIKKAKVLLTKYIDFPKQQHDRFKYRWNLLKIPAPETGYMSVIYKHYRSLITENKLSIAGSVFGSNDSLSIVSCLHESNAYGDMELVDRYYVTILSNFARGYDKYTRRYSKETIPESTFPDQFYLLDYENLSIGFNKVTRLLDSKNTQSDAKDEQIIVIKTQVHKYELHPAPSGKGQFVDRNYINVTEVLNSGLNIANIEEMYAQSLKINNALLPWSNITPRSFSILPIAKSCQAKCDFCFSHSSVSEDQLQGNFLDQFEIGCRKAKEKGAERLVITGGGEPTMLAHAKLLKLMALGKQYFKKMTMITNGYTIGNAPTSAAVQILRDYQDNGLTTLSVSRHSAYDNAKIMHLETNSRLIALYLSLHRNQFPTLDMRWVCVLQKQGVHDEKSLVEYLDWVVETEVKEICFKELYVVAMSESVYSDSKYNKWCAENQVSMSMLTNFLKWNNAKQVDKLPWGSPIVMLKWQGVELKIAVYTEPSVYWERTHGICRSWNLMADGTCYANLETKDSLITFD